MSAPASGAASSGSIPASLATLLNLPSRFLAPSISFFGTTAVGSIDDEQWTDDEEDQKAAAAWNEIVDRARARQRARLGGVKPRKRLQDDEVIYILSLEKDGIDYVTDDGNRCTPE
ncbi:hypothetical protein ZWY2020_023905 [Hordeum vulgare]|nr:hypothetical protein ZWY2020_023905 [Hordeum vulgare]